MKKISYSDLFSVLSHTIEAFIQEIGKKESTLMATDEWTVKDVLCHVVFWHENYATNYKALAENMDPPLFNAPGYKLNTEGVNQLKKFPTTTLLKRLKHANQSLYDSIVKKNVPQMQYKKNSRIYTTPDFLDLVSRHIASHTKQIKKAK